MYVIYATASYYYKQESNFWVGKADGEWETVCVCVCVCVCVRERLLENVTRIAGEMPGALTETGMPVV